MSRINHHRVKEIFLKAVDKSKSELDEFLTQECGDNKDLRDEVESLLKHNNDNTIVDRKFNFKKNIKTRVNVNPFPNDKTDNRTGDLISKMFGSKVKRNLIVIVTLVLLFSLGYFIYNEIEKSFNELVSADLTLTINANAKALEIWIEDWKSDAELVARNIKLKDNIFRLVDISEIRPLNVEILKESKLHSEILEILKPYFDKKNIIAYSVYNELGTIISSNYNHVIGKKVLPEAAAYHREVFSGKTKFAKPFPAGRANDLDLGKDTGKPLVFVDTPIYDNDGNLVASLGFGTFTPQNFTDILSVARIGKTGESYAFDRNGHLLSESRFEDELKELNLIPKDTEFSAFKLQIRDPEVSLLHGKTPKLEMAARPLTKLAALAIASINKEDVSFQQGIILEKYRNYLGDEVVGAWKWMNDYDFGLAVETSVSEVYQPLFYLDLVFGFIFIILIFSTGFTLFSSFTVVRLKKKVGEAEQIGQFTLVKQIGEGGLGNVYLAKHALLKRPTAIKILKPNQVNKETVTRFEREVQLASQLTHPNTIEIYDFGLTPDGIFYYAMEYLSGYTIAEVLSMEGKISVARTAYILKKVCLSLNEAHISGIIHRDIKPHNIMLTQRPDKFDIVKVLDFGLVKDISKIEDKQMTEPGRLSGTLLYMSPERIKDPAQVDPRTDIYSIGATAYYMLTGKNAFDSETNMDIMYKVLNNDPQDLKGLDDIKVPAIMKDLVLNCLAKDPEIRPSSVTFLIEKFDEILSESNWTQNEAKEWWNKNQ